MKKPIAKELQGVWENEDEPPFNWNGMYEFTFYIGEKFLTLSSISNNEDTTLANGIFTIENYDSYRFVISVEDEEIESGYFTIKCRLYMENPSLFVCEIPGYKKNILFKRKGEYKN